MPSEQIFRQKRTQFLTFCSVSVALDTSIGLSVKSLRIRAFPPTIKVQINLTKRSRLQTSRRKDKR